MFVKDEAEISSSVGGVKWGGADIWQVGFFSPISKNSVFKDSKKIISHSGRDLLNSVLKVRNAVVKSWVGRKRSREECHLHEGGGQGRGRDASTESSIQDQK